MKNLKGRITRRSFFGGRRKTNRQERKRVREELRRGREPEKKYITGKFWWD